MTDHDDPLWSTWNRPLADRHDSPDGAAPQPTTQQRAIEAAEAPSLVRATKDGRTAEAAPEPTLLGFASLRDATPVGGVKPPRRIRRRRGTVVRRVRRSIVAIGLLGALYFLVSLFQVWSTGRADETAAVDAIVVLGAAQYDGEPSPQLAARLDHVVELFEAGRAPLVVTTGGKLAGDRFTESEASANYLMARGVPADAIVQESSGRSTWESLNGVADLLDERGVRDVLLVSDPYHMLRSRLIAEEVGLNASVSATTTSPVRGWVSFGRHIKETGGVAIGRILGFERLWNVTG